MKTRKIKFDNSEGLELSAEIDLPAGDRAHHFVLFAHCFTCSKNLRAVKYISKGLTDSGYGVFKFDFTGLGQSGGDFSNTNFSSNIEDLLSAAKYMEEHYRSPDLLIGHSLGGAAVLQAARLIHSVKGVATIAAPHNPGHIKHLFEDYEEEIHSEGSAKVTLAGRTFTIKRQFLEDLNSESVTPKIRSLKKPLLILHSPQDRIVEIKNAEKIYNDAMHPKSFISLDGSDHLMTKKQDAIYAGQVIAQWSLRYIGTDDTVEDDEHSKEDIIAELHEEDGFTTDVQSGTHRWVADEPKSVGGDNHGPAPGQLLMGALASCSAMTVMMYIRRKNWPLKCIRVNVHKSKENSSGIPKTIYNKKVQLIGPELTTDQKNRCLEIAGRCPVHRTLSSSSTIHSELYEKNEA